jgi:hypothetical protein
MGVRVWDVRCGSKSRPRLLLSERMPNGEPAAQLQLDRVKLVAATRRVVLHSPGSIAVFGMIAGLTAQAQPPEEPQLPRQRHPPVLAQLSST